MKKKIFIIVLLLFSTLVQAQGKKKQSSKEKESKEDFIEKNNQLTNSLISNQGFSEFLNGGTPNSNTPFTVIAKRKEIEGNEFLFKNWNSFIILKNELGKETVLNNANFNTKVGTFALATKESIYLLDVVRYKKIIFNDKIFLNTYNPINKSRRYLETIYDSNKFKFLKDHTLVIKETENAGGYIKGKIKYINKPKYYYSADNAFKEINLKKTDILKLFEGKSDQILSFSKKEKLSFKKEDDLKKIFTYYNSL